MKKYLYIMGAWVALAAIAASGQTSQNTPATGSQGNSQGNVPTSQTELQRRQGQQEPSQGFSGQTNAILNNRARGGQGKFQDEAGSETDRRLLGTVREKVQTEVRGLTSTGSGAAWAPAVHFRIQNGVVTIVGTVQSIEIKQQIEECVRRVPGVARVVNEIEFGSTQGGGGESDQVLVTRVREKVLTEIRVSGIDFQCHGGVVTVIGSVPQPEVKERLIALVREVPGVANVTDHVTVGAEVKGQSQLGQPQQSSQGQTERERAVSAGVETSKTNLPPTGRENLPPGLEKKEQLPPGLSNRTNDVTQPRPQ